jgi:hypothetical protein
MIDKYKQRIKIIDMELGMLNDIEVRLDRIFFPIPKAFTNIARACKL